MNPTFDAPATDAGPGFAAAATLAWTRVYTFGLASGVRQRRLSEIESDLWEQRQDGRGEGRPATVVAYETLGRAARGAIDDITWRFQLEGPFMQIHIPMERIAGALMLLLIVAMALSLAANGYDNRREGFETELQRLADVTGAGASIYVGLQVLAGVAMIAAAAVFYVHLSARAPLVTAVAALMLVGAGIIALVGAGVYHAAADLADEWAANPADGDAAKTATRGLLMLLEGLSIGLMVTLGLGVYGLALVTARLRMVPRWLNYLAVASAVAFAAGFVLSVAEGAFADDAGASWLVGGLAFTLMLAWLAVAGIWFLIRDTGSSAAGGPEAVAVHPV